MASLWNCRLSYDTIRPDFKLQSDGCFIRHLTVVHRLRTLLHPSIQSLCAQVALSWQRFIRVSPHAPSNVVHTWIHFGVESAGSCFMYVTSAVGTSSLNISSISLVSVLKEPPIEDTYYLITWDLPLYFASRRMGFWWAILQVTSYYLWEAISPSSHQI